MMGPCVNAKAVQTMMQISGSLGQLQDIMHMALQPGACRSLLTQPTRENITAIAAFQRLDSSSFS